MRVSVAPMIDVTDRHFRYLIRLMSKRTTVWTPMFVAQRLTNRRQRDVRGMLRFHPSEHPVVAQLGGDTARDLVTAAVKCEQAGFDEINVNFGCPATSAQDRHYGASLMVPPHDSILAIMRAVTERVRTPVSAKVRIGVDEHRSYEFFKGFVTRLHEEGGVNRFAVHARRALLDGLVTTGQNRVDAIVPLRHEWVYRLKREMPHLLIEINGGIKTIEDMQRHLAQGVDGVMMGRLARDDPFVFASIDSALFGDDDVFEGLDPLQARVLVLRQYADYAAAEQETTGAQRELLLRPLNQILQGFPQKKAFGVNLRTRTRNCFGQQLHAVLDRLEADAGLGYTTPSRAQQLTKTKRSNNPNLTQKHERTTPQAPAASERGTWIQRQQEKRDKRRGGALRDRMAADA